MRLIAAAALVAGALSIPAWSQDAEVDPEVARLNAEAARDNAAAAATTASTARLKAQMDALGLPTPEGTTTLGTNAAMIETWMLSAATLDTAAQAIADDVFANLGGAPAGAAGQAEEPRRQSIGAAAAAAQGGQEAALGKPTILLLARGEELNLDSTNNLRFEASDLTAKLEEAIPQQCKEGRGPGGGEDGGGFPIAAIGALAGLLKTDTEISGIDVNMGDQMLISAVGRRLKDRARVIIPSAAIAPPNDGALLNQWRTLASKQAEAKECRVNFAKNTQTAWVKKKLAALDAAIARVDALDARVTKPDDKGRIPLAQAIRYDALLSDEPQVLRVHVEKAGGSILKRANLFTALGAPAVGITGGLIVEHNLTDPRTGELVTSGDTVCRTALTNLGDVQAGRIRGGKARTSCVPLLD